MEFTSTYSPRVDNTLGALGDPAPPGYLLDLHAVAAWDNLIAAVLAVILARILR